MAQLWGGEFYIGLGSRAARASRDRTFAGAWDSFLHPGWEAKHMFMSETRVMLYILCTPYETVTRPFALWLPGCEKHTWSGPLCTDSHVSNVQPAAQHVPIARLSLHETVCTGWSESLCTCAHVPV